MIHVFLDMHRHGRQPGKDLKDENFGMFGNDGVNDAIDMVAEGSILRGDVGLDVYDGGAMALLACVKQLDGVETDSVILPMVSVTSENAEEDWISIRHYMLSNKNC